MDSKITVTPRGLWGWGSIAAIAIGSLGPWATLGALSYSGGSRDGMFTLLLAGIAAVLMASRRTRWSILLVALLTLALGVFEAQDVSDVRVFGTSMQVGWGIVVIIAAAISLGVWACVELKGDEPL
jgi:uncharacterized integral membrane protein